jgi:hypothetical protein
VEFCVLQYRLKLPDLFFVRGSEGAFRHHRTSCSQSHTNGDDDTTDVYLMSSHVITLYVMSYLILRHVVYRGILYIVFYLSLHVL